MVSKKELAGRPFLKMISRWVALTSTQVLFMSSMLGAIISGRWRRRQPSVRLSVPAARPFVPAARPSVVAARSSGGSGEGWVGVLVNIRMIGWRHRDPIIGTKIPDWRH